MSISVDKCPAETAPGLSTPSKTASLKSDEETFQEEVTETTKGNEDDLIAAEGNEDEIPVELQLEEVDMNDPDMDPLEWTVRKLIPIPKAYFWETGNYDLPLRTKTWHRVVGFLGRVVHFTDRIGKPVTDGMGLTSSRFSYVTSTMTEEDWERSRAAEAERRLRSDEHDAQSLDTDVEGAP